VDQERLELKVGVFVFVGMVMLGIIIAMLGAKQDLFSAQYPLYAEFEDVAGLKLGAAVRLSGLDVGLVDSIEFPEKPTDRKLKVKLMVRTSVRQKIRADSRASITTQGVLGDKYVAISLGSEGAALESGALIASEPPTNYAGIVETAGRTIEHIESISQKIDAMINPGTGADTKKGLQEATVAVGDILHEVQSGDGLLHKLIYDKESAKLLDHVADASANVSALTADARTGKGVVPALLNDPKQKETLDKLAATVDELHRSTAELNVILGRIDRGEGSLGALINDPGVYDDLRALLGRAKRNRILRTVIRHQIDKNENLPRGAEPGASPEPSAHPAPEQPAP